ncbi:MAG: ABC transporter permease, partial [Flavobacteriales bacterium]|nr:ABC transporter permease [Flavobacteriales bacterium]
MLKYLLKKAAYGLLVLLGVITAVFFLFNLAPGDPARNIAGENAPEETLQHIRRKLDLDLPAGKRYLLYLNDLSPVSIHNTVNPDSRIYLDSTQYCATTLFGVGNQRMLVVKAPYFKRSFLSDKSVSSILAAAIPGTVVLAVVSIGLALLIGLMLGIYAALRKDTAADRLILLLTAIGMSGPSFFVAILVAWMGAVVWREQIILPYIPLALLVIWSLCKYLLKWKQLRASWLWWGLGLWFVLFLFTPVGSVWHAGIRMPGTGLNMTGSLYSVDAFKGQYLNLSNLILPVITLMVRPLSVIVQLTRSSLLEVMQQDYIRTARAKGLTEREVIWRHALRNALNPVVTAVSGWFASLLAGAVFVEFVFGWKGLGQEMFNAIEKQDLPVVMG